MASEQRLASGDISRLHRKLVANELLFEQGQHGDAAYVIETGAIEIFSIRDGVRQTIARLGPNDIFGEMALLGDSVRSASAIALEPTALLVVTPDHLQERLLGADPMTRHLLRTVVIRCREMLLWMRAGAMPAMETPPLFRRYDGSEHEGREDRELAFGRLRTERELESALEHREFKLFFQPIVRLSDRSIAGFEALIRWFKPGFGMVSPAEFIPVAEQSSLINRIGLWIAETAFDSLLRLDEASAHGAGGLFLTVNVSARQLSDEALLPLLRKQVEKLQGRRCQIKLEVTESLMISNVKAVQAFIAECREMGLHLVLDDFGTGYCSLSYLHLFDVHTMKLDRSFVRGMAVSPASEKVVRGIVRMAHDLGLDVVAEGIESADQADQAARLGIDYAQGFLFGRPASLEDSLRRLPATR